ncbi:hypothetical protein [Yersinia intermedia]|uniref:hypothetical protein n=1 Tax=Yersinia intermedia TaxID=631 RepID=UPI000B653EE4|nr:hypothetical protein [Yersinia intermedia]MCW8110182.1 hypothetical protein [Yersinia intermedia]MDA5515099.1 hypothetical protein [Yersinia intermedia]OWF91696.1 hypothetical protein B4916_07495 [Yersinia intermedia]
MKLNKTVIVTVISLGLTGCANVLPLDYKDYTGSDAATLYVLNREGNVGTIYLGSYTFNSQNNCYDMSDRYELDSNIFQAKGNVVVSKIKPNILYSVSQIKNKGGGYILNAHSSLIPEAGKYYYIASGSQAIQVPANFTPDASVNSDDVIKDHAKNPVKYWNVKNICTRPFWKIG